MVNQVLSIFDEAISDKCWIGKYGRLAITAKQMVEKRWKRFPVSCAPDDENCQYLDEYLQELMPDDKKTGVAFWKTVSPTTYTKIKGLSSVRNIKKAETVLEFVAWVNIRKITTENSSANWCSDVGNIVKDAIKTFDCKSGVIPSGLNYITNLKIEVIRIGNTETFRQAMSEYSINNIEALTVWPFAAFTLTVKLSYLIAANCIPEYECSSEIDCSDMTQIIFRKKLTLTFSDFTDPLINSKTISAGFDLVPKTVVHNVFFRPLTTFSGGTLSNYTVSLGASGDNTFFTGSGKSVFTGTTHGVAGSVGLKSASMTGTVPLTATAVSTGGNLGQATQGELEVWVYYSILD